MYETKAFKAFVKKSMKERDRRLDQQAHEMMSPPSLRKVESIIPHRRISKAAKNALSAPLGLSLNDKMNRILGREKKRFNMMMK